MAVVSLKLLHNMEGNSSAVYSMALVFLSFSLKLSLRLESKNTTVTYNDN